MVTCTIQRQLADALFRLSFGKLSYEEASIQSKKYAGKFDLNDNVLAHKGVNWFAKELLKEL